MLIKLGVKGLRFAELIVRRRRLIMVVAVLLLIPAAAGFLATGVNYDVTAYLAGDMPAKAAQQAVEEHFGQASMVYVLLPEIPLWQAGEYKSQIAALPGVEKVQWLDDATHVSVPPEFMPEQLRQNFLTEDGTAMFVTFTEGATSQLTEQAIVSIRHLTDDQAVISGFPAIVHDLGDVLDTEKWYYALVAVAAILLVLSLSTSSTFEPVLLLVAVGFSVIYNMGSNVFLGSISFITQSIAAVLQLAVSMDYGIFLIHRFSEEKARHASPEEAMAVAISKTSRAISASALTTVAGFAALIMMQFGLGKDLGIVMAKGVLLSALGVLVILPGLLLSFQRLMERYQHRVLLPSFSGVAQWVVRRRAPLVSLLLLLLLPVFFLQQQVGIFYSVSEGLSPEVKAVADLEQFKQAFGISEVVQLLVPDQGLGTERALIDELLAIPNVQSVVSLSQAVDSHIPQSFLPETATATFRQDGYALTTVQLATMQGEPATNTALAAIEQAAGSLYPEFHLAGEAALTRDLMQVTADDMTRVNAISVVAILLIIALSFGSISVPVLLVLAIEFAIWSNLSIAYAFGNRLYFVTYLVLGAIQLGATVDYAILLTSKYQEALRRHPKVEAMQLAVQQSFRSILTSALALTGATIAVALLSRIRMAGQMCAMLGMGALISMLTIIFVLPGLLLYCQPVLEATTLRWPRAGARQQSAPQAQDLD